MATRTSNHGYDIHDDPEVGPELSELQSEDDCATPPTGPVSPAVPVPTKTLDQNSKKMIAVIEELVAAAKLKGWSRPISFKRRAELMEMFRLIIPHGFKSPVCTLARASGGGKTVPEKLGDIFSKFYNPGQDPNSIPTNEPKFTSADAMARAVANWLRIFIVYKKDSDTWSGLRSVIMDSDFAVEEPREDLLDFFKQMHDYLQEYNCRKAEVNASVTKAAEQKNVLMQQSRACLEAAQQRHDTPSNPAVVPADARTDEALDNLWVDNNTPARPTNRSNSRHGKRTLADQAAAQEKLLLTMKKMDLDQQKEMEQMRIRATADLMNSFQQQMELLVGAILQQNGNKRMKPNSSDEDDN